MAFSVCGSVVAGVGTAVKKVSHCLNDGRQAMLVVTL
jgi:hypothetical protein